MVSHRLVLILAFFGLCNTAFSPLPPIKQAQANHSVASAALEIVAEVNTHRMSLGINPLALNTTLSKMAEDQAQYVQSLNFHPENYDFHKDARGEYPRQRALHYKWPTFGPDPKQIEIGENAGLGSVQFIMDYWRKSNVHRTAMENPVYREVGVGVVEHEYGYFMILVFGSRPNTFPSLFDPERCLLFMANEQHTSGGGQWLRSVESIQLTTSDGAPITQPQAWKPHVLIPPASGYQFSMVLRGDDHELLQAVDLQSVHNTLVIPNTLPMLEKGEITTKCVSDRATIVEAAPAATQEPTLAPAEVAPVATATTPAQTEVLPTATPKVETINNASGLNPSTTAVSGLANVNRGSNLQCREYPSSTAFSLGLIPSGASLTILGLPGARDERVGFPDGIIIEVPDYAAARLGEGIELNELWLQVQWQMPEGTFLKCWVNAFYVSATYNGMPVSSVASYLDLVQRGQLDFIPYNVPGGASN